MKRRRVDNTQLALGICSDCFQLALGFCDFLSLAAFAGASKPAHSFVRRFAFGSPTHPRPRNLVQVAGELPACALEQLAACFSILHAFEGSDVRIRALLALQRHINASRGHNVNSRNDFALTLHACRKWSCHDMGRYLGALARAELEGNESWRRAYPELVQRTDIRPLAASLVAVAESRGWKRAEMLATVEVVLSEDTSWSPHEIACLVLELHDVRELTLFLGPRIGKCCARFVCALCRSWKFSDLSTLLDVVMQQLFEAGCPKYSSVPHSHYVSQFWQELAGYPFSEGASFSLESALHWIAMLGRYERNLEDSDVPEPWRLVRQGLSSASLAPRPVVELRRCVNTVLNFSPLAVAVRAAVLYPFCKNLTAASLSSLVDEFLRSSGTKSEQHEFATSLVSSWKLDRDSRRNRGKVNVTRRQMARDAVFASLDMRREQLALEARSNQQRTASAGEAAPGEEVAQTGHGLPQVCG